MDLIIFVTISLCFAVLDIWKPGKLSFAWYVCIWIFGKWLVGKCTDIALIGAGLFALAAVLKDIRVNLTTYIETIKKNL